MTIDNNVEITEIDATDQEMEEIVDDIETIKTELVDSEGVIITEANPLSEEVEEDGIFMDDETLKSSIAQLLDLVVDEETLKKFGWPVASIENVLSSVIEQCGQKPADYNSCPDYTSKMRENVKLLFTTVIDNESIKAMLNNNTIDEVIKHVLKLAKS